MPSAYLLTTNFSPIETIWKSTPNNGEKPFQPGMYSVLLCYLVIYIHSCYHQILGLKCAFLRKFTKIPMIICHNMLNSPSSHDFSISEGKVFRDDHIVFCTNPVWMCGVFALQMLQLNFPPIHIPTHICSQNSLCTKFPFEPSVFVIFYSTGCQQRKLAGNSDARRERVTSEGPDNGLQENCLSEESEASTPITDRGQEIIDQS